MRQLYDCSQLDVRGVARISRFKGVTWTSTRRLFDNRTIFSLFPNPILYSQSYVNYTFSAKGPYGRSMRELWYCPLRAGVDAAPQALTNWARRQVQCP